MDKPSILVVDDKENIRKLFTRILGDAYEVRTAEDGGQAISLIQDQRFDVVVTDIRMPGADGFEVLRSVKQHSPGTEVILMTAYASIPKAVEAIKEGAYDYLQKPFDPDDAALVVARASENAIERAKALRAGPKGGVEALPPEVAEARQQEVLPTDELVKRPFREAVEQARDRASRDYLIALLREMQGNVTRAAQRAGMERESLHRLLKRYGLKSEDFKTCS